MCVGCWVGCNSKASRIPNIAEWASSIPLEALTPDVIFIPNEIEIRNHLHFSHSTGDIGFQDES